MNNRLTKKNGCRKLKITLILIIAVILIFGPIFSYELAQNQELQERVKVKVTTIFLKFVGEDSLVGAYINGNKRPVIVIDAGHGGFDGGAVNNDGTTEEDITLAIAKELHWIASSYPVDVVMTREDDTALSESEAEAILARYFSRDNETKLNESNYVNSETKTEKNKDMNKESKIERNDKVNIEPKQNESAQNFKGVKITKKEDLFARKKLIDELQPAIAVSIHLNNYINDVSVCGAQCFYPKKEQKRTSASGEEQPSKLFAESIQKSLESNISDGKERQVLAKNDMLLFKNTKAPTVLIECGFLSNDVERNKLKTAEYQRKLAESIWEGINAILCLEKTKKLEIIDSANKLE